MPGTNFPSGVSSFGIPLFGASPLLINPNGGVFYVNSLTGQDNRGRVTFPGAASTVTAGGTQGPYTDPAKPLATLAFALSLTQANRSDTIILMAGHVETFAAAVSCPNAGVTIYGCGNNTQRPTINTVTFPLTLSGVGCSISNVIFNTSTNQIAGGVVVLSGSGCQILNCKFLSQNTGTVCMQVSAANCQLLNNEVDATTTGASAAISVASTDNTWIAGNEFRGIFTTVPIQLGTTTTSLTIEYNLIYQNSGAIGAVIGNILTATSGLIANNTFASKIAATPAAYFTGTNVATNVLLVYFQNFGFTQKAGPGSAILVPAAGTIP